MKLCVYKNPNIGKDSKLRLEENNLAVEEGQVLMYNFHSRLQIVLLPTYLTAMLNGSSRANRNPNTGREPSVK